MVTLPERVFRAHQDLPELIQASPLPARFEDSTHQIWQCETTDGRMILKCCEQQAIQHSSFWQGMKSLFDVDLPEQLDKFDTLYTTVSQLSPLTIPEYIKSAAATATDSLPAFILCRYVDGQVVEPSHVNSAMCKQLADHLLSLHQQTHTRWGQFNQPRFAAGQWPRRLQDTLKQLAVQQQINAPCVEESIALAAQIQESQFVPLMPDLRWDQLLRAQDKLTALLDLDAFVYAPAAIDWIILEYILTPQQARDFAAQYQTRHSLPDLQMVRSPYRLLLFLMNILGSRDLEAWMTAPHYW